MIDYYMTSLIGKKSLFDRKFVFLHLSNIVCVQCSQIGTFDSLLLKFSYYTLFSTFLLIYIGSFVCNYIGKRPVFPNGNIFISSVPGMI